MSNPNGWGDGSVNNNIGWGQGANNSNGWGKSQLSSWSGATDIDGGDLPSNSVAPAITGTAQEGQTLTCSTGIWSGSSTYTYQWKRNGNNIGGATSSTYLVALADVGQNILCTVTATNFVGSASANSNTVIPTSSVDADAQAFITAAAITDPTQQAAINTLVVDLKGYNVWSKMKALYPFVGGTAAQHKWNLKDPRDLDAAFRLVFSGGGTHSVNGYQTNGINANAQTKLIPSSVLSINSKHVSVYSRTNISGGVDIMSHTIGPITPYDFLATRATIFFSNEIAYSFNEAYPDSRGTNLNSTGFFISTRTASNAKKLYKNNSILLTASSVSSTQPTNQYVIGSDSRNVDFTNRQYAFASIGDGLTDTEAANFYTAVQAFQTTLGRQI